MTKPCVICQASLNDQDTVCPTCGARQPQKVVLGLKNYTPPGAPPPARDPDQRPKPAADASPPRTSVLKPQDLQRPPSQEPPAPQSTVALGPQDLPPSSASLPTTALDRADAPPGAAPQSTVALGPQDLPPSSASLPTTALNRADTPPANPPGAAQNPPWMTPPPSYAPSGSPPYAPPSGPPAGSGYDSSGVQPTRALTGGQPDYGQSPYAPQQPGYGPPPQQPGYGQSGTGPLGYGPPPQQPSYGTGPLPPSGTSPLPPPGYGTGPLPPPGGGAGAKPRSLGPWLIGFGLLLLLIGGGAGLYAWTNRGGGTTPGGGAAAGKTPTPAPTRTPRPTERPAAAPTAEPTEESQQPTEETAEPTPAPTISPDSIKRDLPAGSGTLIYVSDDESLLVAAPASGGPAKPLSNDYAFTNKIGLGFWSPDGSLVANYDYAGDGAQIYLVDIAAESVRETGVLTNSSPDSFFWSPDNSKIAFVTHDDDAGDDTDQNIWVIEVASGAMRQITTKGGVDTFQTLAWSPDGSQIAFLASREDQNSVMVVGQDGSGERPVFEEFAGFMVWLPDGRLVVNGSCGSAFNNLCEVDLAGGEPKLLLEVDQDLFVSGLSPDGTWLMAEMLQDNSLRLINLATGKEELVSTPPSNDDFLYWGLWSPDGKYVTFRPGGGRDSTTFVYEPGAGQPARPLLKEAVLAWIPE